MKAQLMDIHQHVLFGIDDGAANQKMAQKMIREAVRQGLRIIIATPHVRPGARTFDYDQYQSALDTLNAYCEEKGYDLKILPGAEIRYTESTARLLKAGKVPTMNGTDFILVEWSTTATYEKIFDSIRELTNAGYQVIIAHAERFPSLFRKKRIEALKDTFDARVQVDCDAVLGRETIRARWFVKRLLKNHLVDFVATDAHDVDRRPLRMKQTYDFLKEKYDGAYAEALTGGNQREIFL